MLRVERDVDENGDFLGGREDQQQPVDLFQRLMDVKHVFDHGSLPNTAADAADERDEDSLEEKRSKIKYAMGKLDRVDKLVKDFVKACNKDDFMFSLINARDNIVFSNMCRKDQKTFETCVLNIVRKQRTAYDDKVIDLEDTKDLFIPTSDYHLRIIQIRYL